MLRMKTQIWVAILLVCLGLPFCLERACWGASAKIEFAILPEKDECKLEEPIYVNFKLQNKDKSAVYVNKRFYLGSEDAPKEKKEVFLIITSPSSTKLPCKYSYETGLPKCEYFELLEPGKEVTSEFKRDLRAYFDFTQAGTYQIVAVYQNVYGKEIGLDTFRDKVVSQPISIKILPKD